MIELTRLNGNAITVNCDLIKLIEALPDTVLSLMTGDRLIVRETPAQIVDRIAIYRARILQTAWPDVQSALAACNAHHLTAVQQP